MIHGCPNCAPGLPCPGCISETGGEMTPQGSTLRDDEYIEQLRQMGRKHAAGGGLSKRASVHLSLTSREQAVAIYWALAKLDTLLASSAGSGWQPITTEMRDGWFVVTNNMKALDRNGVKSHVWLTTFVQIGSDSADGEFICYDDGDRRVRGLTHYQRLDLQPPSAGSGSQPAQEPTR